MGCLKSIIKKILILCAIVAFFALGGWAFVKEKIKAYQNPTREEFIETEKEYADFSFVSSDYQLSRSFNLFGYKKLNAKYLPTGQKITILDLKNEVEKLSDDEKKLILERYYHELTQSETSSVLGISQVQVSRNEAKILKKLKTRL